VLNGIGGCTVAEAKNTLSVSEAHDWFLYMQQRGSLNVGRRIDRGFAMLSHFFCLANGIKIGNKIPSMDDLMPSAPKPKEVCTDVNQAFAFLKSVKAHGK
jgi:hypothetical protein